MGWVSFREDALDRKADGAGSAGAKYDRKGPPVKLGKHGPPSAARKRDVAVVASIVVKGRRLTARLLERLDGTFLCRDHVSIFPATETDVQRHLKRWHSGRSRCSYCGAHVAAEQLWEHVDVQHAAARDANLRGALRSRSEKPPRRKRKRQRRRQQ